MERKFIFVFFIWGGLMMNSHAQIISDNQLSLAFRNIFNWNCTFVGSRVSQLDEVYMSMIFFKEKKNPEKEMIMVLVGEYDEGQTIKSLAYAQGNTIIDSIPNPYNQTIMYILKKSANKKSVYALIDHFGYIIMVTYIFENKPNYEKFKVFIKSYENLQLNLGFNK